jgi:hypothetical protein
MRIEGMPRHVKGLLRLLSAYESEARRTLQGLVGVKNLGQPVIVALLGIMILWIGFASLFFFGSPLGSVLVMLLGGSIWNNSSAVAWFVTGRGNSTRRWLFFLDLLIIYGIFALSAVFIAQGNLGALDYALLAIFFAETPIFVITGRQSLRNLRGVFSEIRKAYK